MSRQAKPKVNSAGQRELDKAQEQFDKFDQEVKNITSDVNTKPPAEEVEPQTKLSSKEVKEAPEIYLKPTRTQYPGPIPKTGVFTDKFNEKFREQYEYDKQYVRFIAENYEIIGEEITIWTRPYGGLPAEEWKVPTNKPVWGPRYLAEQLKRKSYRRLKMEESAVMETSTVGSIYGKIVVDTTVQRLDARPAPKAQVSFNRKASNF